MKTPKHILNMTAFLAATVAASAITFPPVLMPEGEKAGGSPSTRNTYYSALSGTVYTVWEAPPVVAAQKPPTAEDWVMIYQHLYDPSGLARPIGGMETAGTSSPDGFVLQYWPSEEAPGPNDYERRYADAAFLDEMLADFPAAKAGDVAAVWTAITDGFVFFPQDKILAFLTKVADVAKSGAPSSVADKAWAGYPLSKQQANAILVSVLTFGRKASGLDPSKTAMLDFLTGGTRYIERDDLAKSIATSDGTLTQGQSSLTPLVLASIKSQVDFTGVNFASTAFPPTWSQNGAAAWGQINSAQGRNFALAFRGINLAGTSGVNVASLKTLPSGALTGANLAGSGITRAMLEAPPYTRPATELNTIKF